jgi:ABC-type glycerol-3-phosphate transport system substrate-binding protein
MDWNEQQAAFAGGKAAMMVQGLWSYLAAKGTNPALDCGFVPFPVSNDIGPEQFLRRRRLLLRHLRPVFAREQLAAKKFLNWLATLRNRHLARSTSSPCPSRAPTSPIWEPPSPT